VTFTSSPSWKGSAPALPAPVIASARVTSETETSRVLAHGAIPLMRVFIDRKAALAALRED
jgi:hypothetical protein